jgi:hypothetical protein
MNTAAFVGLALLGCGVGEASHDRDPIEPPSTAGQSSQGKSPDQPSTGGDAGAGGAGMAGQQDRPDFPTGSGGRGGAGASAGASSGGASTGGTSGGATGTDGDCPDIYGDKYEQAPSCGGGFFCGPPAYYCGRWIAYCSPAGAATPTTCKPLTIYAPGACGPKATHPVCVNVYDPAAVGGVRQAWCSSAPAAEEPCAFDVAANCWVCKP